MSGNNFVGKVSKEYVAIPRANGAQDLPGLSLSYFDLNSKKYKRLSVEKTSIEVTGDEDLSAGNVLYSGSGQSVDIKGSDIRYVKNEFNIIKDEGTDYFASGVHHSMTVVVGLGALFLLLVYQPKKQSEEALIIKKKKGSDYLSKYKC